MIEKIEQVFVFLILNTIVVVCSILIGIVMLVTGVGAAMVSPYLTWLWFKSTKKKPVKGNKRWKK